MTNTMLESENARGGVDTVRVETALSRFPIHALSGEQVQINIYNLGTATKWEVSHNSKYGIPGQLAYKIDTLVINRKIEEEPRPIQKIVRIGSLREIANLVSINGRRGADSSNIKKSLHQNASAYITAKICYKTKDGSNKEIEFGDTRYAVVFTGEKLPNGKIADAVYIILHDIYREIINSAQTRPLDYAYMKTLPPMAQRFYEIVSYVIYAALLHRNQTCKMRYSEFCKLSTATRYFTFDQVKKQMYKIHKPHVDSGYLRGGIRYQATVDEDDKPDWWILYEPGENAGKQYEDFVAAPPKGASAPAPVAESAPPQEQGLLAFEEAITLPEEPSSPESLALTDALVQAGVSRAEALALASAHPEECRRQLDYLPYAEIRSTPGAYLASAVKGSFGPPRAFQEVEAKRLEEERRRKAQEVQAARERAEAVRREAEMMLADSEIDLLEADEPERYALFQAFVAEQKNLALNKPFLKRGSRMAEAILQGFDTPEKRRELFLFWKSGSA